MHRPVMLKEVLEWLQPRSGGRYLDGTVGEGGHSEAILEASVPDGQVLGLDRDPSALAVAAERLRRFGERLILKHADYRQVAQVMHEVSMPGVHGALLDLGVSSRQLDTPARGFSFLSPGPLDMRMDPSQPGTAADLVNRLPEPELARLLYEFGEERYSRRIARALVQRRAAGPLLTTQDLVDVIRGVVPRVYLHGRLHFATRTFQALRIAVNRELEGLQAVLRVLAGLLWPGGRLVVLSFHSLEDRIVKHTFRELALGVGERPVLSAHTRGPGAAGYTVLTKRPMIPSAEECAENPRARSAKLRVLEKQATSTRGLEGQT